MAKGASAVLTRALALTSHYTADVTVDTPRGPGWVPYAELVSPAGMRILAERAAIATGARSTVERSAAAGLAVGRIASILGFALTGALCLEGAALRIAPEALAIRIGPDGPEGLGVAARGLELCAEAPEATTAAVYADLVGPILTGLAPLVRRGRRALWVDAGDRLVTALFNNVLALGGADAPERAAALLSAAPATLQHRLTLMALPAATWKRRAVCCLAYQTPATADYCMTCPHLTEAASADQVAKWLARR